MSEDLIPCPFCESTDLKNHKKRWIECNGCGAYGPNSTEDKTAEQVWNDRAKVSDLSEEVLEAL